MRRQRRVVAVLLGLVLVVAAASLAFGGYSVPIPDLVHTLLGQGDGREEFVVMQLRLPRLAMGIAVGVAFSVAGGLFQSILGNPLASPDILGITGGASVAAVWALIVLGLGGLAVSLAAFGGAAAVALAIYALAWRSGMGGYRFVLIGIGFAFMAQGALGYMLTRGDVRDAQSAMVWLVGSLSGSRWDDIAVVAICLTVLLPAAAVLASRLRVLQLGDDAATALGVRTEQARLAIILVAVALAATGTAAAGPLAFVAFVSAPIARRLARTGSLALIPTALIGVLVVTASDFVALHLLPGGTQVPVGVITGAIGAPYLLWLLAASGRAGRAA